MNARNAAATIVSSILLFGSSLNASAQTLTTLYSFTNGTDGSYPNGLALGSNGFLYGTSSANSNNTGTTGTIYQIDLNHTFTTLHQFPDTGALGGLSPGPLIVAANGNFYGQQPPLGNADPTGTLFEISPAGTFSTVATGGSSAFGAQQLFQGSDGNFYGTNGSNAFKVTPSGTYTLLGSLSAQHLEIQGQYLIFEDSAGNVYGVAESIVNGSSGNGEVFKLSPTAGLTSLYSFTGGCDGAGAGTIIRGSDGNFYGTTSVPGTSSGSNPFDFGSVFKLTPSGTFTTLFAFDGQLNGLGPHTLIQGSDGNLYGTTAAGGANNAGTVFKLTTAGQLSTLYSFKGQADGSLPVGPIALSSDLTTIYGTAQTGGAHNYGAVYELSGITPSSGTAFSSAQCGGPIPPTPSSPSASVSGSSIDLVVTDPTAYLFNVYLSSTPGGEGSTPTYQYVSPYGNSGGFTAIAVAAPRPPVRT